MEDDFRLGRDGSQRHETYDARFLANNTRMLLACGLEDRVPYNDICGATMRTVPFMRMTPGRARYLDKTGHALDNERPRYWADQVIGFLGL